MAKNIFQSLLHNPQGIQQYVENLERKKITKIFFLLK